MFTLDMKLRIPKKRLKEWNTSYFGNVQANVKHVEETLNNVQKVNSDQGHSDLLQQQKKCSN